MIQFSHAAAQRRNETWKLATWRCAVAPPREKSLYGA